MTVSDILKLLGLNTQRLEKVLMAPSARQACSAWRELLPEARRSYVRALKARHPDQDGEFADRTVGDVLGAWRLFKDPRFPVSLWERTRVAATDGTLVIEMDVSRYNVPQSTIVVTPRVTVRIF